MNNNKQSEYLDIVDENNVSLGIARKRALVHQDSNWHRAVHISGCA